MQIINVDLIPGKVMPILHASQFDKGRSLGVKLYNGGAVFELSGAETLTAAVRKPDGNIVTETLTNAGGSLVEIITTEQMTACAGCSLCEIKIENAGDVIGTANFVLDVEEDPTNGGIESESEIDNLATQVAGLVASEVEDQYDSANVIFDNEPTEGHGNGYTVTSEGIKAALDAFGDPNGNISDSYDPATAYVKGDLCIYENVLYICTAPTTGTFDPSKWTATTIDNVIGDLSNLTTTDKSSLVGAVNEVVSNKANKSGMFKIQTFTTTYSVAGNGSVSFDNSFITVPTGYVLGAVLEFTSGQGQVALVSVRPNNGSQWAFELVNTSSVARNNQTFIIRILFIKSDLVS